VTDRTRTHRGSYIQLTLRTGTQGRHAWVRCLRTTAAFYGWDQAFPTSDVPTDPDLVNRVYRVANAKKFRPDWHGQKLRICRSTNPKGYPAGQTNQFRVSYSTKWKDLAELAHFTQGDWVWMEDLNRSRTSRARWEELYLTV
jgi:hypothetical protein